MTITGTCPKCHHVIDLQRTTTETTCPHCGTPLNAEYELWGDEEECFILTEILNSNPAQKASERDLEEKDQ